MNENKRKDKNIKKRNMKKAKISISNQQTQKKTNISKKKQKNN